MLGIVALIAAALGVAGFVVLRGDLDSTEASENGGKAKKKKKKKAGGITGTADDYSAAAEPSIPDSAALGRIDPSKLSRGDGRAVKGDAREIDEASTIAFVPDTDPYCKDQARLTDIIKEVGYNIDRELRSTASISEADEERIGDELFKEVAATRNFAGKIDTPAMAAYRRYITELAVPLLVSVERKHIVYEFHTIDDPTVNAFAIPGGHIFFFRGILEKPRRIENEAQLAGVLAHEINHVDKRHTIAIFEHLKRLGNLGGAGAEIGRIAVTMARHPFSTTQEDESDAMAVKFLMKAEYSPTQFVTMWKNWADLDKGKKRGPSNPIEAELQELLATHSRPERRACNAMKNAMLGKPTGVDRYYVGTTNYKEKQTRARKQY